MNFDYEKAKALLISVLHEKREEAEKNGKELRVQILIFFWLMKSI